MGKKTDLEILSHAVQEEVEGVAWYQEQYEAATNPEAKALYKTILVDEKKHAQALINLLNKMVQSILA